MPTTDRTIRTSHGTLSVRASAGNGLPIVLIHGPSCSKEVFVHQFKGALAREFRLIAIDLPGHGGSSDAVCAENTYSVSGYADAVIEVLEFHGIERAVAVGSSLGGQIALEMMASSPMIVGVMLAGSAPLSVDIDGQLRGLRRHADAALLGAADLDADSAAKLRALLGGDHTELRLASSIGRTDRRARAMLMADVLAGNFADQRALLETLAGSVAIINGACDPFVDYGYVARLPSRKLWASSSRVLPLVGNMPFVEVPEIFNHLLKMFARDALKRSDATENKWGLSLSA